MPIRKTLACLLLFFVTLSAFAVNRWFPLEAKRGTASFAKANVIVIDGTERKPAPGLRIWNTQNMIVFRHTLKAEKVIINYTEDQYKLINNVWLLSADEAAKPLRNASQSGQTTTVISPSGKTTTVTTTPTSTTVTSPTRTTTVTTTSDGTTVTTTPQTTTGK